MRASQGLAILLDAKAKNVYEVSFKDLTSESQEDIGKSLKHLKQYTGPASSMFALIRNETVAMAIATLNRIALNLEFIKSFILEKAAAYGCEK